jgi:hypothetical protein
MRLRDFHRKYSALLLFAVCFQQDPFFRATKDNNGVQIFLIYPNNDLMCAISRDNVQIILISDIKVFIKVQLVFSVWKKTSLSKSGYVPPTCTLS